MSNSFKCCMCYEELENYYIFWQSVVLQWDICNKCFEKNFKVLLGNNNLLKVQYYTGYYILYKMFNKEMVNLGCITGKDFDFYIGLSFPYSLYA